VCDPACGTGPYGRWRVYGYAELIALLIRPDEVLSRIFDVPVLKVANDPLGRVLQHRHMFCGRLA